ncbi:class I SAM-dependent methyltransferase [Streptantibioticus ferralitis]|uniref:Class I SAM-dependent methyltransferase n=1 Tax=Streptantibioticus ferralitis TaxID=236510 RepID=A0ABT5YUY6_9ACTN|nr:class I SAM-dependent methyltransferase [Streptantibioticus ferralitis]MDF2255197.1 class I SAM-dependent methyltransferase [Streptantibioticus ferralitis]
MTSTESGRPARKATARAQRIATLRSSYQSELADGTGRFFEPRRADCPWCGSTSLRVRLRTTDLLQHKPGSFTLNECRGCGHVFQNPRLTTAGLDFYYRDFYDGLGEQRLGAAFGMRTATYRNRARTVVPFAAVPHSWLDVGTGHGHFCETAHAIFPEASFDGLDLTEGVQLAERLGRVTHGFRGSFPELAPELAGRYDVVSMFHYLEHTADPQKELLAARQALRPGGLLLVEVPDPRCRYARLLGRWWLPWLQPQHLNMMPAPNLRQRLTDLGFTVLLEQHDKPHDAGDLLGACWLLLDALAPREDAPWLPGTPPGRVRRAWRDLLLLTGVPVLLLAALLDHLIAPFAHRAGLSNAYRLLARREAPAASRGDGSP